MTEFLKNLATGAVAIVIIITFFILLFGIVIFFGAYYTEIWVLVIPVVAALWVFGFYIRNIL